MGIQHSSNEPAPIPSPDALRGGAGLDELISCIKVFDETRPYNFFNVDDVGAGSALS